MLSNTHVTKNDNLIETSNFTTKYIIQTFSLICSQITVIEMTRNI